ncbi:MAG: DUF1467 family protein [Alphaproteobacteria bacterium]|nr:DUF1467 family protein [Alphaproteobacteria bacterium]
MGVGGSIVVLAIAWWLSFIAVSSWGGRSQAEAGEVVPGSEPAAPENPFLFYKALAATFAALVIWGVLFAVIEFQLLTLDDIPFFPRPQ